MSGHYRGRGRSSGYRGNYRGQSTARLGPLPTLPPDRIIEEGLESEALQTLAKPSPTSTSQGSRAIKPENLRYIGSYNWVEETTPTIIVPGSPPVWRERTLPYDVPFDAGVRMVDQNSYRMGGSSSLLPLFRAVEVVAQENGGGSPDWSTIDFVTDRNGLRKLMRWLRHSGDQDLKEFRIDLQLGGSKTVLMQRWEKRTREIAVPPKSGCGINFERESTSPAPGCERSAGHHRIVEYELDGLKLVVRFEVDACAAKRTPPGPTTAARSIHSPRKDTNATSVDDLANALAGLGVSSATPNAAYSSTKSSSITVIWAGSQLSQNEIVELVTRSERYVNNLDWKEIYPQLLLSYTPSLYIGLHNRGTFRRIEKYTLGSSELRHVETDPTIQQTMRQLVSVLRTIQQLVKEHGERGKLSLVCRGGFLKVHERTSDAGTLPDSELARFRS
ncbi:hypothetical protein BD414DRAFT_51449 [Trametes punicea]|nr:hypothetical protein BD414DRAFT_51449 [Trametes punicea]